MIVPVMAGGDHLPQHRYRVRHGAAINPAVQVAVGAGDLHLDIAETPHPDVDRRRVEAEHGRIADQDDVGLEEVRMCAHEFRQVGAADLLFAFDDEFDVGGQGLCLDHRLEGLYMHIELALVIGGTPGIDLPVFYHGLEGTTMPQIERVCGLDIIMPIHQYGRFTFIDDLLPIHDRVALRGIDLRFVNTGIQQALFYRFGAFQHIRPVFAPRADR